MKGVILQVNKEIIGWDSMLKPTPKQVIILQKELAERGGELVEDDEFEERLKIAEALLGALVKEIRGIKP